MHIILGQDNAQQFQEKYIVLELDQIKMTGSDQPISAYCVIEQMPLEEMLTIDRFKTLHENLIENYRKRNWKYCVDAVEHLRGRWHGDLDSFYDDIERRSQSYLECEPGEDWQPVIDKSIDVSR